MISVRSSRARQGCRAFYWHRRQVRSAYLTPTSVGIQCVPTSIVVGNEFSGRFGDCKKPFERRMFLARQ